MKSTMKYAVSLGLVVVGLCLVGAGCLTRPVIAGEPLTQTNVSFAVQNEVITKVDMLFDIDNSASMGDKQLYLTQAIPDLVNRLVNPYCVDANNVMQMQSNAGAGCMPGTTLEFNPVRDMHLGIVSSSLGSRLSETGITSTFPNALCAPNATATPFTVSTHNDDQGHLLARSLAFSPDGTMVTEGTVNDATVAAYGTPAGGYLYYYPPANINGPAVGPATSVTDSATLEKDFENMVGGVGTFGCGIESQMESWYRFLIQPDPYQSLGTTTGNVAAGVPGAVWNGVDATILKERHDFLRPDSLEAVVVLSDENDSEIDVRSLGGIGYYFMRESWFPTRGTSVCATTPLATGATGCHSCGTYAAQDANDPSCKTACNQGTSAGCYSNGNDWGYDPNLRHVHMRQKYGVDPQFPIERYYTGLTSPLVPDRAHEYPSGASNYMGGLYGDTTDLSCVNPLYAASLPDGSATDAKTLCNLTPGSRTVDQIFFVHIGGVPWQLLHFKANDTQASTLSEADWTRILGKDPEHYDYNGIDPHMYESYLPRTMLTNPPTFDTSLTNALADPTQASTTDPVNGREWITDQEAVPANGSDNGGHILQVDRQYACTFKLQTARDCTLAQNNAYSCDCPNKNNMSLTHQQIPSVCDDMIPTQQDFAKAYPTVRELTLAHMMAQVGNTTEGGQGVVSSICPQDVNDNTTMDDPLYGYRPAVAAIIDRLKTELTTKCLPHKLTVNADGSVPCLLLVQMPMGAATAGGTCKNPTCPAGQGVLDLRSDPTFQAGQGQTVLNQFCDSEEATYVGKPGGPGDPAQQSICELKQLTPTADPNDFNAGSCAMSGDKGWCYVTGVAAKTCSQAIYFANGSPPSGSTTTLSCLEQSVTIVGDAGK
jgi:hypothetical protein